jgi:hypothetical protein
MLMLMLILTALAIITGTLFSSTAQAQCKAQLEKDYAEYWCDSRNGELEHRFPDRTSADCLTQNYVVEVDFDEKWAEAIGQSLFYSTMTDQKPAIVMIIQNHKNTPREQYLDRLSTTIDRYNLPISVFTVETGDYPLRPYRC